MTRPEKISKRKAFNKALRTRAAEEQTSFASVLTRTQSVQGTRSYRAMLNLPTHPARPVRRNMMDVQLDDTRNDTTYDLEYEAYDEVGMERKQGTVVIDLMAIAKPAKVKGVAKEFEIVKRVKDVIVLEDQNPDHDFGEDDWEAIDFDEGSSKPTYSAALRGK